LTPLRSIVCKTKHAVALSEWVAELQNAVNAHCKKTSRHSSKQVLEMINRLTTDAASFEALLDYPPGMEIFSKFLEEDEAKSSIELHFFRAVEHFRNSTLNVEELALEAKSIINRFLADSVAAAALLLPSNRPSVIELSEDNQSLSIDPLSSVQTNARQNSTHRIRAPTNEENKEEKNSIRLPRGFHHRLNSVLHAIEARKVTTHMFDNEQNYVRHALRKRFLQFMGTNEYHEIEIHLKKAGSDDRKVSRFDPSLSPHLLIRLHGATKDKTVVIKQDVFTIGRDKANNLVIDDDRVSRSHARFEYDKFQCEYIDLGSLKGSLLNGKKVLRAKLMDGDILTLGRTQITFQLKKNSWF